MADEVRVGSRVRINLHGRRVGAWVVEDGVEPMADVAVKPLAASSGEGPPAPVVDLAQWAAWRWAGPLSSFLGTASPARVVRRRPEATVTVTDPPASPGGGSVALVDSALADTALVAGAQPVIVRLAPALDGALVVLETLHRLGPDGVVVLVPSHHRAAQLAARLRAAGCPVSLLPDDWERAAQGTGVVVGTRVAAWAPVARLRAAVVLDAHDEAYREERSPTWSAVDVLVERGRR
jgi:primosomal protein N' (replication factor Y)